MNILATSGGFRPGRRTWSETGPIIDFAFELAGSPQRPKFCYVGTAGGDNPLSVLPGGRPLRARNCCRTSGFWPGPAA